MTFKDFSGIFLGRYAARTKDIVPKKEQRKAPQHRAFGTTDENDFGREIA
jgi:hypothetical protein